MAFHQLLLLPNHNNLLRFKILPQTKSSVFSIKSTYVLPTTHRHEYSKTPTSSSTIQIIVPPNQNNNNVRRSANYQPSTWRYEDIQSLTTQYGEESYVEEREGLKEEVRMMISKMEDNERLQLELIDVLQKLGVASHFRVEISDILQNVYTNNKQNQRLKGGRNDLYATALQFRLLRQHGYHVSSEIFRRFQDDEGEFNNTQELWKDIEGMVELYEASFHGMEGESILDEATHFCSNLLKEYVDEKKKKEMKNERSVELASHALEIPLHWRVPRLESIWYIQFYQKEDQKKSAIITPALLQLAKLDFNIVQATHQQDLKHISRWWKESGLREKLSFARDRPMESFFWAMGMAYQPEFRHFRREMTKLVSILTIIDDIYDIYGTLEELQLFTQVVHRWDINAVDSLPEYMKICFLALYNFVNQIASHIMKETGYNIIPYLKKGWGDLCKSYMNEAKWYYNDYTPSFEEYLENAWISGGGAISLLHSYFLIPNSISHKDLDCFQHSYPNLFRHSATILRLTNDLASYKREMKRGDDVAKSIKCYMSESGGCEEDAHKHVYSLMCQTWKEMNEQLLHSPFSQTLKQISLNLARISLCIYQHENGHSLQDSLTKNRILSLFIHPIPITYEKLIKGVILQ